MSEEQKKGVFMQKNSSFEEQGEKAIHFSITRLAFWAVTIIFLTVIVFTRPFQLILTSGPLLILGIIATPVVILIFIITCFCQRMHALRKTILLSGIVLSIYLLGCASIVLFIYLSDVLFGLIGLWLIIIAIILGIVISSTSFRSKTKMGKFLRFTSIVFLSLSLVMIAPMTLNVTLPFIYTPPALNSANLKVYNQCLNLLKSHGEHEYFKLNYSVWISLGADFEMIPYDDTEEYFTKEEIIKIRELRDKLYKVKCFQVQRVKDFVLFYKDANYILPVGPGVVYSLNGENPNESGRDALNAAKPFTRIAGNWYLSRKLMLQGPRTSHEEFNPKSLIDHSLRIEGLDLDDKTNNKLEMAIKE